MDENTMKAEEINTQNEENAIENYVLSDMEIDALGEIGNICMGTAATTLSTLLGKAVSITTPRVSICRSAKELGHYQKPFLAVEVSYTKGVSGYNILLMQEDDARVITRLLMDDQMDSDMSEAIDELHFSVVSEIMNQMVGSSSTALSSIIKKTVNISPPNVQRIIMEDDDIGGLICHKDVVIKIGFNMEIEGVLQSELMQILQFDFGKELAAALIKDYMGEDSEAGHTQQETVPEPAPAAPSAPAPQPVAPSVSAPAAAPPAPQHAAAYTAAPVAREPVGVKSMQYPSFDGKEASAVIEGAENINLLLDVPLQVTVELGNCKKSIKEILGLNMGSIIVLDRLAGEMVDIMVNGKLFAKGEVVVIDDNYGVRVTDIVAMPTL
ncbi:MAG: flagellar motor switch phosphatase FliY [Christensenellales bacterium]|jgi:flagellar motor switch protein FliN/FliY